RAPQVLAGDDLAGAGGEDLQRAQGLGLHVDAQARPAQLARRRAQLEDPEAKDRVRHARMLARPRRAGKRMGWGTASVVLGMLAACGGGGGATGPASGPSATLIAVAGDYTMAVALTE